MNCFLEAVVLRCSANNVFKQTTQFLQKNTYVGVSFLIKLEASHILIFVRSAS